MKGFCEETLGSIANPSRGGLVDGPFGSNLPASEYVEEGVPVLRGSNLSIGPSYLKENEFVFVSRELTEKLARSICRQGDIIFTKKGTLGQTGFISESSKFKEYLLSSNQMKISVDCRKAIPKYVYYYVSSPSSISKIIRDAEATGVPKTNVAYLKTFPILLPSISEQQAILDMIAPLDDKIELNRRMNETLEAMARAVFRDWFVDFGPTRRKAAGETDPAAILGSLLPDPTQATPLAALFPDSFGDNGLPEGWEEREVGDLCPIVGGGTPSTKEPAFWDGGTHNWATPKDLSKLSGLFLRESERQVTDAGLAKVSSGLSPVGSVLLSSRAPIGYVAIAEEPVAVNQGFIVMQPTPAFPTEFAYFWTLENLDLIKANANGSTFQEISKKNFRPLRVNHAGADLVAKFAEVAGPMMDLIRNNEQENQTLAATRDLLLPKLMSGDLRLTGTEGVT
ncbi:restriction endonuclease subunit S [Chachezhania antarctica]|uniref:restriction endonuclease subunit S n=1 Tax=Chachezhania antarctica TaxID=2340860 RepID=UPI000EACE5EA|nr:restriction endonuclease subunit S [Chachezhania antarctica]|tara:strand:- start:5524 stop:6882 length:1359 start_codon:yes stop_codon:yes gene_type:complete